MQTLPFEIGDNVEFSKTVSESDVYLFAGITGDFSPNHVNEQFMSGTQFKTRIAHGVLSIGFASTASTMMAEKSTMPCVSYGYDRIRFIKPIFIGDTLTVKYVISSVDYEKLQTVATIEIYNQRDEICTAAQHILRFYVKE